MGYVRAVPVGWWLSAQRPGPRLTSDRFCMFCTNPDAPVSMDIFGNPNSCLQVSAFLLLAPISPHFSLVMTVEFSAILQNHEEDG